MAAFKWYKRKLLMDPLNHYIITTDQGTFERDCRRLDFRKTKENYENAGYTNVNVCLLGKKVG